jgi:hemolysin activation/secretion protein
MTFNAQNTDVDVAGTPTTIDRNRWITLEATYDQDFKAVSLFASLSGSQGLSGLGATSGNRLQAGRFGGEPDFRLASGNLELYADIAPRWSAIFQATGQYALDPLPDAVRFGVGGEPFGRAFAGLGIAGDSGFGAAVELAHVVDFSLSWIRQSSVYGFADYGYVRNDAIGTAFHSARLGSAGAGMRAFLDHGIFVDAFLAVPTIKSSLVEDDGGRALFTLGFRF